MSNSSTIYKYEKIDFPDVFPNFQLVRIFTAGDGSCFFHAICQAYFRPYITGTLNDEPFDRDDFVKNLRKDLAKNLSEPCAHADSHADSHSGKSNYRCLANGLLKKMSKSVPECSLKYMTEELAGSNPIGNLYNEFISDNLNIDIYILDAEKRDVYMTGTDNNLLYKKRKSVVVLYLPGHYELIGIKNANKKEDDDGIKNADRIKNVDRIKNDEGIETYFKPSHPFILQICQRMAKLQKI